MKKYNWATLGCGVIANELAAAMEKKGEKLYSVANRTHEKAVQFAEKYGIEKVYDNIDQPSSKLKACMELIKTMQENKQKVLLFSSFTSVLDLIAEECQKAGITYYMLTGSTNKEDRRELVSRFQKDDTTVFLISLKAGGTGLNLTSAEAVIHFDPWWNVSAQNQATDRAYRIGQKNNVQVFNLVMKDSVEEKIIELQKRKKELADMFVENNSGGLSQMSKEDILSLFTM